MANQAVSGSPLRRVEGRSPRLSGGSPVRRDRPGGAPRLPRAEPVQRRPSDPAGVGGGGRPRLRRLAGRERTRRRRGGALGARAELRRPRRRRPDPARDDRRAEGRAVRDGCRPPARANAPRPEGGAPKAPPRGARAARADLPSPRGLGAVRPARPAARTRGGGNRLWRIEDDGISNWSPTASS